MENRRHDLKTHQEILKELCRLCSCRLFIKEKKHKAKSVRFVEKYNSLINQTFGIDVSKDDPKRHPEKFYQACLSSMYNAKRNPNSDAFIQRWENICHIDTSWNLFDESDLSCFACLKYNKQSVGGRPCKGIDKLSSQTQENCRISDLNGIHCDKKQLNENESSMKSPLKEVQNIAHESCQISEESKSKSPLDMTVKEIFEMKGPASDVENKLLGHIISKYDKNELIKVKTKGTVCI